jgi:hypothetical protein
MADFFKPIRDGLRAVLDRFFDFYPAVSETLK